MTADLIEGDCLDVMRGMADGSVDAVVADPPYGTTDCYWDRAIPSGPLWDQLRRVLRPRGAVVLMASQPFTSMLVMSNPGWFRYSLVWDKGFGVGCNAKRMPIKKHEDIVVFSASGCGNGCASPMTYNPQGLVPCDVRYVKLDGGPAKKHRAGRKLVLRPIHQTATGYPGSVLRIPTEGASTRRSHPTQKPVALMEYLVLTYSDPGDTVLDFCMGSGTTGVACLNTGRRFVGIESDPAYLAIARARLAAESARTPLLSRAD